MASQISRISISIVDIFLEYINFHNLTDRIPSQVTFLRNFKMMAIIILVISVLGTVGNGAVIWLLGFRIKRNPFMTYILNLAVADFGVLLLVDFLILEFHFPFIPIHHLKTYIWVLVFLFIYSTSQYLLTAISIDRCVAVFFPIWHQCKRPPRLSTIVCVLIWILSALLFAVTIALAIFKPYSTSFTNYYQLIMNAVLCLPVMAAATVSLFIKVCLKARQPRKGRLLTIVLITLLFFLLCAFPYNVIFILEFLGYLREYPYMPMCGFLLGCLNSSVNPVIYFLVGRKWKSRRRENLKMILQNVFKEEEGCAE